jgi:flagellar protein FliO/FliZ
MGFLGWLARRFGSERLGAAGARGRQPRLAVIDAAAIDGRRRLILIRRDNVEHLLMIGGPTDLIVEPNIVRATAREAAPARSPTLAEAIQRPPAAPSESTRPTQPEPAPAIPAPPRPQRQPPAVDEPMARHAETESRPPLIPPRQSRSAERLAGLATELSHQPGPGTASRTPREREGPREPLPPRAAAPQNIPAEAGFSPAAEHNLGEMAQRLEAALRRPRRLGDHPDSMAAAELLIDKPRSGPIPPPESDSEALPEAAPEREPSLSAPAAGETRPTNVEAKPGRDSKTPPPRASAYDSLEQEMANLLGRPNKT